MDNIETNPEEVKPKSRAQFCRACKAFVMPLITKSGNHWRADCPTCKKYIKFIGKKDSPKATDPAPIKKIKFKQPLTREQLRNACLDHCHAPGDYWDSAAQFLDQIGTCARHILSPRQQSWLYRIEQQIASLERQQKQARDHHSKMVPLRRKERHS